MRHRIAATALVATAALAAASATSAEQVRVDNLLISFSGGFAPRSLPRDRPAPVELTIKGRIGTTDGTHPPALRHLEVALNSNGTITTRGLPVCRAALLQSTTTQAALAACRPALVGRGRFGASLEFAPGSVPSQGTVLAFNSRQAGGPALLLHFYGSVPVRATFVLPLRIDHRPGRFGTVLSTTIPKLAGGVGSVTDLALRIGRRYRVGGEARSFLSASCAAPAGFPGAIFPFARGTFSFVDGEQAVTTLTRDCKVR